MMQVGWLVGLALLPLVRACSPNEHNFHDYSPAQQTFLYDRVLLGKVRATFPDERFNYGSGTDVYTAVFEVFCTYKGDSVPHFVNVTDVGFIPGHCHQTELIIGKEYVVMVMKTHSQEMQLKLLREVPSSKFVVTSMTQACGLTRQYPESMYNMPVDPDERCLEPAPPSVCEPKQEGPPSQHYPSPNREEYGTDDDSDYPDYRNEIPSSQKPHKNVAAAAAAAAESSCSLVHLVNILYFVTLLLCISLS